MATIVTRAGKGAPLTVAEHDANLTNLNDAIGASGTDLTAAEGRLDTNEADIDTLESEMDVVEGELEDHVVVIDLNTAHRGVVAGNPHGVTKTEVGLGNVTNDAQLTRGLSDFTDFTEKTDVVDDDVLLLEDSEDMASKVKATVENVVGATKAEITDLTDGGDTTLHDHDGIDENTAARHTRNADDKITEGNTTVETVDAGTGEVLVTVDGNEEVSVTDAGLQLGGSEARVNTILDDDSMTDDSAIALATQQSVKAYVDNAVVASGYKGQNHLINGGCDFFQRGGPGNLADSDMVMDRFRYYKSGSMVQYSANLPNNLPSVSEAERIIRSGVYLTTTAEVASLGSTDYCCMSYLMEGLDLRPLWGNDVCLSFWAKHEKTGIYSVSFQNADQDATYVCEYTINATNTWEFKYVTLTLDDSAGTWAYDNTLGMYINFVFGAGSNYQAATNNQWNADGKIASASQVNAVDEDGGTQICRFTGFKLELGTTPTGWVDIPYEVDWARCKRYYQSADNFEHVGVVYNAGYILLASVYFPVDMRIAPSMAISGVAWLPPSGGGWGTIGTLYSSYAKINGFFPVFNTTSGTVGYSAKVQFDWTAEAELG